MLIQLTLIPSTCCFDYVHGQVVALFVEGLTGIGLIAIFLENSNGLVLLESLEQVIKRNSH